MIAAVYAGGRTASSAFKLCPVSADLIHRVEVFEDEKRKRSKNEARAIYRSFL